MDLRSQTRSALDAIGPDGIELSHRIHAEPELAFAEHAASELVASMLVDDGFAVQRGVADLPTALSASYGDGELVVGLFAEYDALPGVGHACGHNIIAAAAVTAGRLLAPLADQLGITVRVFGTPAEENGGGKVLMLDQGVFDDLHAAMMVHPGPRDVAAARTLAVSHLAVDYTGRTSHAAAAPEKGRNAADAFTVAQVGVGLLRQHLPASARVHGIITDGGEAPNIVPGHASGRYYVRAETADALDALRDRVEACFRAGALATGTELAVRQTSPPYTHFESDPDMHRLYQANAERLGRVFVDEPHRMSGSTDMANVSLTVPTIHPGIGLDCGDAVNHQPEFAQFCAAETGDRAVLDGALAMAWTVIDLATSAEQSARLRARSRPTAA